MLDNLERERDSIIFQLQTSVEMENFTNVAYLVGKLTQLQDLIINIKEEAE
jgi:hypothetical protein